MYKLIAVDLDGSLLKSDLTISDESRRAIHAAIQLGVNVTLATGRMFSSALPYARQLGLDVPLITDEGSLVRMVESRQTVYYQGIDPCSFRQLINFATVRGLSLNVYVNDNLYVDKETPWLKQWVEVNKVTYTVVGDLHHLVGELRPNKIAIVSDSLASVVPEAKKMFGSQLRIVQPRKYFLVFLHPNASKGVALHKVSDYYSVDISETVAIGDGENDLSMFKAAGLSIAMGNAPSEIKEAADFVTSTNDKDGVAKAIYHLLNTDSM